MNFEAYGRAESRKMRKFVLRAALRPNQIKFSHSLGPLLPWPGSERHGSYREVSCRPCRWSITGEFDPKQTNAVPGWCNALAVVLRTGWRVISDFCVVEKPTVLRKAHDCQYVIPFPGQSHLAI